MITNLQMAFVSSSDIHLSSCDRGLIYPPKEEKEEIKFLHQTHSHSRLGSGVVMILGGA